MLFIEVCIAFSDGFIRHTLGDYFVVILLYAFIKSFTNLSIKKTAVIVLTIAFVIEFLQLTNLQNWFPTEHLTFVKLTLGTSFSVGDLLAYTLGIITVLTIENSIKYWYEEVK